MGGTFKADRHQQVDLPVGTGQWALQLDRSVDIRTSLRYVELPGFIETLVRHGHVRLAVEGHWPRDDVADTARRLKIAYIDRFTTAEPSKAIFFMPGSGGLVTDDPNVITEWIEAVLQDPDYADTTAKLLAIDADERHVFVSLGTRMLVRREREPAA